MWKCSGCPEPIQSQQDRIRVEDEMFHKRCFYERYYTLSNWDQAAIQRSAIYISGDNNQTQSQWVE